MPCLITKRYPLVISHSHGESLINGGFNGKIIYKWAMASMAMWVITRGSWFLHPGSPTPHICHNISPRLEGRGAHEALGQDLDLMAARQMFVSAGKMAEPWKKPWENGWKIWKTHGTLYKTVYHACKNIIMSYLAKLVCNENWGSFCIATEPGATWKNHGLLSSNSDV